MLFWTTQEKLVTSYYILIKHFFNYIRNLKKISRICFYYSTIFLILHLYPLKYFSNVN